MSSTLLIALICGSCGLFVIAKECSDVDVRNSIFNYKKYLRNCSVINGNLSIVLIENSRYEDYDDISFPELREITGVFLMYRVNALRSLGKLFPNLQVIGGKSLLVRYSFVLYELWHLTEIGLHNLTYIAKGSVRIEKCPELCYINTTDWGQILNASQKLDYFDAKQECPSCPEKCKGFCWNQDHCQLPKPNCHQECIFCNGTTTAQQCNSCRSFNDSGTCVNECPKTKIPFPPLSTCLTNEECNNNTFDNTTWWVFNGKCVYECPPKHTQKTTGNQITCEYCGENCTLTCEAILINSMKSTKYLRECTHITNNLTIHIETEIDVDEMEKNLGKIQEIGDFLRVYRSPALTDLKFLKNLQVIHGKNLFNGTHSFLVYENRNLLNLWNWDNFTLTIENGSMFFHYNSLLCHSEIEKFSNVTGLNYTEKDVSFDSNGDKAACDCIDYNIKLTEINSTNVTFQWKELTSNVSLSGYKLYYTQDPFGNMTFYDGCDECGNSDWESTFIINRTSKMIANLNPYTQYAYYMKIYTSPPSENGPTVIKRFTTAMDDPSEIKELHTIATASDSVMLIWEPPMFPNGEIKQYVLLYYFEKDDEVFLAQRNYCQNPRSGEVEDTPVKNLFNFTSDSCCNEESGSSNEIFHFTCGKFEIVSTLDSKPGRCKNYMYSLDENGETTYNNNSNINLKKRKKRSTLIEGPSNMTEEIIKGGSNLTKYEIKQLKHFTMYIFLLKACNDGKKCSPPVMAFQRTSRKEGVDDIPSDLIIRIEFADAFINWPEPIKPNALIVSYKIEYQRNDINNLETFTNCVTRQKYVEDGYEYELRNLIPGKYSVRIQAISLAGPGKFTEFAEFVMPPRLPIGFITAVTFGIVVVGVITAFCFYRYYYKKQNQLDRQILISNEHSDYTGPIYVEDDWEIEREEVVMSIKIGEGFFGTVHSGFLKSQSHPCAIKTINHKSDIYQTMVFLNDFSIMKSLSKAHHVVKLLGVVSRGKPPLVVMELMARGDLKTFLWNCRSSPNAITCAEMYRMAAEIADGMMYLAAKKFVRRDLAARNCMVSADYTVKIGDFGMTRDIYTTDCYTKKRGASMSIRWMSPESLADGVFTTDSDVWSYGVLLWELATLAELPYQGLTNNQVLQFVIGKGTLERPRECPDLLYEIMVVCWKWRPNHRPLFKDIVEKLESHVGQHFRLVSFYHSAEGEEHRMKVKERIYNAPAFTAQFTKNTAVYWNGLDDNVSI